MAKILLIDNYDSFTYNLVQAFLSLGAEVDVHRNNEIAIDELDSLQPTHLVISPGPGRPENAGISLACIEVFQDKIPILGVCLGHQCIVEHFGGDIVYAKRLMHGKTSTITHDGLTIFAGLDNSFEAGRYPFTRCRQRHNSGSFNCERANKGRRSDGSTPSYFAC